MPKQEKPKGPPLLTEKPKDEQIKYLVVLVEGVQQQVRGVAESLDLTRQELKEEIASVRTELKQDIQMVWMATKSNKDEIIVLQKDVAKIHKKLEEHDKRFDKHDRRFDEHDKRFDRLEGKLDRVIEKVERHEEEIVELKTAV